MRTLISGASGLVGCALVESLHTKGHNIRCLQRDKKAGSTRIWNTADLFSAAGSEDPFETVIHLAGENIAQGRWSMVKKQRVMESRVEGTRQLIDYLATLPTPPQTFICASAIGYYGNRGDEVLSEMSKAGSGFLSEICRKWEAEAHMAEAFGARVINLRFGMVLSPKGGGLHKMLPPFKVGIGGPIGNGRQFMSWVSIRDIVEIVDFVIHTESIRGPVNVVAPEAVNNKEFTKALSKVLGRPAKIPSPPFILRLLFGEMADEMILASIRVSPDKLLEAGYCFQDVDLEQTLKYCIHGA